MKLSIIFFLFTALIGCHCLYADNLSDLNTRMEASRASADTGMFFLSLIGWALVGGGIGAAIGSKKGVAVGGFFLGALLGPLGWLIMAVTKGNRINCPSCRELIDPAAVICPKCHSNFTKTTQTPARHNSRPTIDEFVPPPPKSIKKDLIRIAKNGDDWGEVELNDVRGWLTSGDLTLQDHYYDSKLKEWVTLENHSLLANP